MLSNQHFYHRTIRRNVIAFGTLFKHIQMVTYDKDTTTEIDRVTVPLTYAGKEDYITRLLGNPDLHKETQIDLPRMSFEMTDISYDSSRKLSSYLSSFSQIPGQAGAYQQYIGTPYNLGFELNLYVRNVEDGTQIVEQILPYFNPDYTLSMVFVDSMGIAKDVPIILESIRYDPSYQGMSDAATRILTWTLTFKMKTFFFGPIISGSIIRTSTANTYLYNTSQLDNIEMFLNPNGFGSFKLGETVYQGTSLPDATATADVLAWDSISGKLVVTNAVGNFQANANVHGTISSASHNANTISTHDKLLDSIVITPNPFDANLNNDFGFTEVNTEYV